MSAIVLSTEQVGTLTLTNPNPDPNPNQVAAFGRQPPYYVVRYLVNDRPAIAKRTGAATLCCGGCNPR